MEGKVFRDLLPEFTTRNVQVLGISRDTPADNLKFRDKFAFSFDLLSDEDGRVSLAYGAIGSVKEVYPQRISYLIDPEGVIVRGFPEVEPATHPGEILRTLVT